MKKMISYGLLSSALVAGVIAHDSYYYGKAMGVETKIREEIPEYSEYHNSAFDTWKLQKKYRDIACFLYGEVVGSDLELIGGRECGDYGFNGFLGYEGIMDAARKERELLREQLVDAKKELDEKEKKVLNIESYPTIELGELYELRKKHLDKRILFSNSNSPFLYRGLKEILGI